MTEVAKTEVWNNCRKSKLEWIRWAGGFREGEEEV